MAQDIKELIGALMRVLGGSDLSRDEVEDLAFDAEGELQAACNEGYIKLMEFAFDRDARLEDRELDAGMRAELERCLNEIVRLSDG